MISFETAPLPENHPEFVAEDEIEAVKTYNRTMMEADISGRCAEVRASIFSKLARHNAIADGEGWAVFGLGSDDEEGTTIVSRPTQFVLIHCQDLKKNSSPNERPQILIRILVNELLKTDTLVTWIAHDFTLDHEDDSLYNFSAVDARLTPEQQKTYPQLFLRLEDDGTVSTVANMRQRTVSSGIQVSPQNVILPYGTFYYLKDYDYNITWATKLMEQVQHVEPLGADPNPGNSTN